MANLKPATGEVIVEEKRTRVESPAVPGQKDPSLPTQSEFMDWIERQPKSEWERLALVCRLWRGKDTKGPFIGKFFEPPFSYEFIQANYGGGDYHILGYQGPQLRWNVDIAIAGKEKDITTMNPNATGMPQTEVGQILNFLREQTQMFINEMRNARGGDAAQDAVRQAVSLSGQVFSSAVNTVREVNTPPATANPMDALYTQLMSAMIQKMLNPADPIEQFTKMLGAMQGIPGLAGGGNGNTSVVQDLIRALPSVVQSGAALMGNLARGKEAELRYFEQARAAGTLTAPPQLPGTVAAPQPGKVEVIRPRGAAPVNGETKAPEPGPHAQPAAAPADAPPPPNDPSAPPADYGEHVEERIANIVLRDIPVKDAAYQVLIYLDMETGRADGTSWVDNMLAAGEEVLLGMFSSRRILQRVPQNPRLTEFVKEFLDQARQSRAPEPSAPQQTEAPQPSA